MDKIDLMDASFITTSPSALPFLPKNDKSFYIPNPSDESFETLNNFKNLVVLMFFCIKSWCSSG